MEIVIQSNAHTSVVPSPFQNLYVLGPLHPDFGYMKDIQALLAQHRRGMRSEARVQQERVHATRLMLNRSSSRVAAA